ncbi:MAG: hypothetical protein DME25_06095 [Verrucomicrobia bacterium]|nr:MAG: hypothetical protein DME25_06095 [Verrucomicrobiota bacterium]
MPRYRVIIHGRNFRLNLEGKWEKFGFYTPRFADAPDPLLAEHTALEDFRQSAKFHELTEATLNTDDDPPVLRGEDIEEIVPGTEAAKAAGLALYRESAVEGAEPDASPNGGPGTRSGGSGVTEGPPSVS